MAIDYTQLLSNIPFGDIACGIYSYYKKKKNVAAVKKTFHEALEIFYQKKHGLQEGPQAEYTFAMILFGGYARSFKDSYTLSSIPDKPDNWLLLKKKPEGILATIKEKIRQHKESGKSVQTLFIDGAFEYFEFVIENSKLLFAGMIMEGGLGTERIFAILAEIKHFDDDKFVEFLYPPQNAKEEEKLMQETVEYVAQNFARSGSVSPELIIEWGFNLEMERFYKQYEEYWKSQEEKKGIAFYFFRKAAPGLQELLNDLNLHTILSLASLDEKKINENFSKISTKNKELVSALFPPLFDELLDNVLRFHKDFDKELMGLLDLPVFLTTIESLLEVLDEWQEKLNNTQNLTSYNEINNILREIYENYYSDGDQDIYSLLEEVLERFPDNQIEDMVNEEFKEEFGQFIKDLDDARESRTLTSHRKEFEEQQGNFLREMDKFQSSVPMIIKYLENIKQKCQIEQTKLENTLTDIKKFTLILTACQKLAKHSISRPQEKLDYFMKR